jgi:hypothetical protein
MARFSDFESFLFDLLSYQFQFAVTTIASSEETTVKAQKKLRRYAVKSKSAVQ